jgi:hypothetical protein
MNVTQVVVIKITVYLMYNYMTRLLLIILLNREVSNNNNNNNKTMG